MAYTAGQIAKISSAISRAYSSAKIPITWTKAEFAAEINPYDSYLNTEQVTAKAVFSATFQAQTTNNDLRNIDIVMRMARYLVANPQYLGVLKNILREIEGFS